MSRIGKLPIPVPSGVDVAIDGQQVTVKGPKGSLSHVVAEPITVGAGRRHADRQPARTTSGESKSLHGLSRTLIANMVTGVTEGYIKNLEIVGTGYRVAAKGGDLEFALGFSHPVLVDRAGRHLVQGRDPRPGSRSRASTSRRSAKWPPTSASCASLTRTRARACATRVRSSVARPERRVSSMAASSIVKRARRSAGVSASRRTGKARRHFRLRKKVVGTESRPRLVVTRSARHLFVQVVDDSKGVTLASASTFKLTDGDKTAQARQVGTAAGRVGQGRRRQPGRVRPGWQHLHRPDRGVRRRRPGSRPGVLMSDRNTARHVQQQ